ncbi:DNA polymerase [Gregarina niphandrodes]|uniref:DNA polymerase n=1 Tax=Gregarina niphandrodes TaxID=110365 RepID=A0A023B1J1_GRENI|nr:DNA polymerase [Gregarina niphandrodes]EZG46105.1 DNA polymerase [Gregarina niphandrodes]|eukprot:XP_011132361.1 DNA polymerase [Gregarina niphandrodes]
MFFVNKGKELTSKPIQLAKDAIHHASLPLQMVETPEDAEVYVFGDDVWEARYAVLDSLGLPDPRAHDCYRFSTITSVLKRRLSELGPPDAPGIHHLDGDTPGRKAQDGEGAARSPMKAACSPMKAACSPMKAPGSPVKTPRSKSPVPTEWTPGKRKWSREDDDSHSIKRSKEDTTPPVARALARTPANDTSRDLSESPVARNELLLTTRLSKMKVSHEIPSSAIPRLSRTQASTLSVTPSVMPPNTRRRPDGAYVEHGGGSVHRELVDRESDRQCVLTMLREFTEIYHIQGEQFRRKAYESAFQFIDLNPSVDLRHDSKIGLAVRRKIDELLTTGRCQKLEYLKRDPMLKGKRELLQVFGVGLGGVEKFLSKGIVSVQDLRNAVASGKVMLDARQQVGLRHYDDFALRIPRWEVEAIGRVVEYTVITYLNMRADVQICGSYRRGAKDCGDADILIFSRETERCRGIYALVDALKKLGFVHETLLISVNPDLIQTYMGVCKIGTELSPALQDLLLQTLPDTGREDDPGPVDDPGRGNDPGPGDDPERGHGTGKVKDLPFRRLDLKLYPYHMKPFALIQWTGGEYFNRALKIRATSLGYRLSEKGLFPIASKTKEKLGPSVVLNSEKEVFEFLKVPYK